MSAGKLATEHQWCETLTVTMGMGCEHSLVCVICQLVFVDGGREWCHNVQEEEDEEGATGG